jgi:hypothetical protein
LVFHRKAALFSGCSVSRGLGVPVTEGLLARAGLIDHEVHCLSFPSALDKPTRTRKDGALPSGWKEVPTCKDALSYSEEWREACLSKAWERGGALALPVREAPLIGFREPWWADVAPKVNDAGCFSSACQTCCSVTGIHARWCRGELKNPQQLAFRLLKVSNQFIRRKKRMLRPESTWRWLRGRRKERVGGTAWVPEEWQAKARTPGFHRGYVAFA